MTVGTAARNKSPSWFKISTDYSGRPTMPANISSPENLRYTPTPQAIPSLDKGVIL